MFLLESPPHVHLADRCEALSTQHCNTNNKTTQTHALLFLSKNILSCFTVIRVIVCTTLIENLLCII